MEDKTYLITSLRLFDQPPLNLYQLDPPLTLKPLSRVNLFVGQNNSGKSRFLREVFSSKEIQFKLKYLDTNELKELVGKLIEELNKQVFVDGVIGLSGITVQTFIEFQNSIEEHYYIERNKFIEFMKLLERISQLSPGTIETNGIQPSKNFNYYYQIINAIANNYLAELKKIYSNKFIEVKKRFYIPIIRGMRPLEPTNTNLYLDRTRVDYFRNSFDEKDNLKWIIFTGLELYSALKNNILGEPEDRDNIESFQLYLSKYFFNDKRITLIPKEGADTVYIKIGEEPQLPIYNLGDGLQNLIIILFYIFLERENSLFFIEEPDLAMHPGLQRVLIEQMLMSKKHQFFLTTHSNHLLDLTLDYSNISVFHFSKKLEASEVSFQIKARSNFDRQLLQDLGVRNSSVFLANCTIWVEGITDRIYLRHYLERYLEEINEEAGEKISIKEDIDYTFVEYQGSNITHWDFSEETIVKEGIKAFFLAGKPLVISDGDIVKRKKRTELLKDMLEEKFIVLGCKEIENLIPDFILKKYLYSKYPNDFTNIVSIVFNEYYKNDLGLGEYLNSKKNNSSTKTFATESGTIKNKINFCNDIINIMESDLTWKLTDEIKDICKKILIHIREAKI